MSTETPNPQPGDRVRVSFEGVVDSLDDNGRVVTAFVGGEDRPQYVATPATVEVLERADDPREDVIVNKAANEGLQGDSRAELAEALGVARDLRWGDLLVEARSLAAKVWGKGWHGDPRKDLVGTIRREPLGGHEEGSSSPLGPIAIRWTDDDGPEGSWHATPWVFMRWDGPQLLSHETVSGWPLDGAVPGTPAAEAQTPVPEWGQPGPRPQVRVENAPGLSILDRQRVADLLVSGDVVRAVRAAAAAGLTGEQAERYVRDMEEWQTYLNHHGHSTEVDPTEADRMRAMGFDRQPEVKVSAEDRAEILGVLQDRWDEFYRRPGSEGQRVLHAGALSGVVADIVWAAIKQDRERGDR